MLITPNSAHRAWILFETGAAWYSQKTLVPALVGMEKEALDEPMRLLQVLALDAADEAGVVFGRLGVQAPELKTFVNAVRTIASTLPSSAKARPEWQEATFDGERYVWGGPVHQLPLGAGKVAPLGVYDFLKSKGLALRSGFIDDPDGAEASQGYHPLFLVDKWDSRHWLWTKDRQVLYAKPSVSEAT